MVAAEMTNGVASGWSVYPGFLTGWDAITAAQAERERLRG